MLNAIEERSLSYEETRYDMSTISDAVRTLFNIRQKDDEDLVTYATRLKTIRNITINQIGDEIQLPNVVKNAMKQNKKATKESCQKKGWERLMAFIFIDRADKNKYGMFIENLKVQHSLGNTQYPHTIEEAHAVLSVQKIEKTNKKSEKKKPHVKEHHDFKKYEKRETIRLLEHWHKQSSTACRYHDKPKSEWHVNQAKEIQQVMKQANGPSTSNSKASHSADSDTVTATKNRNNIFEWEDQHIQLAYTDMNCVPAMAMSQRQPNDCKE